MLPAKKILCPTDFSEPSYKALKTANDLAMQFSSELILIHIITPMQIFPSAPGFAPGQPAAGGYITAEMTEEIREHAQKSLEMAIEDKISPEVKVQKVVFQGNPAEGITSYAEENDIDVIVIGTHGYTGWRHLLIGSVTEKVVRSAPCPVLTIPADKEQ